MVADIVCTFGLSLAEVDEFDWVDMCKWHAQHTRIVEERAAREQLAGQMSTATLLGSAFGGASAEEG